MSLNQSSFLSKPNLLEDSKQIVSHAISFYQPKAIVMMFSGGDDSLTAYHVAKELGINFDYIIFGDTRTGIEETRKFVISEIERTGDNLLIADAKDSYLNYVLRKGFFGSGESAHTYAYHVLKIEHFRKSVSQNLRKRKRDFPILFINGARRNESENRKITMKSPYKIDPSQKNNIWVNVINEWDKHDCIDYLEGNSIKRNPVSVNLCRSGECMCGTMQSLGDRNEASFFYPKWGKWISDLEKEVLKKFPWKWGENINKYHHMEMKGQLNAFQPMCTGCKVNFKNK
jgi:3'-phosphoadenosine 5'-phosphosulfate sulfotransferase (PAPS reductase)/FAD synthetase